MVEHNPSKMAAMEGNFKTTANAPFWIIGIPDEKTGEIKYGIKIPGLLSLLATGSVDGVVVGLEDIPENERPPVLVPFLAYHGMLGLGVYMLALSMLGGFMLWRKKLFESKWLMRIFVISVAAPYLANQFGWVASEVGRQPWIVWGLLRTSEALSKAVHANAIITSLIMFSIIYTLLFFVFIYSLDRKIKKGPEMRDENNGGGSGGNSGEPYGEITLNGEPSDKPKKLGFLDGLRESDRDRLDASKHPEPGENTNGENKDQKGGTK
jgi:cytochrome d ubiquinol oxidase subunit I